MSITMTENAVKKVSSIKRKRQTPDAYFRVALKGGGCSGLSYHYDLIKEPDSDDKVFEFGNVKICIDKKSYLFLNGSEIDYTESLIQSGFTFNNPSAKRSCGCGDSFTI
jgi:iron-sulfur cluster assembly protein